MRLLLLLLPICLLISCHSQPAAPRPAASSSTAPAPVNVDSSTQQELGIRVAPARRLSAVAPVAATGQLQLNEDAVWKVGAITDGKVVDVPTRVGDQVAAGHVLARLHSHDVHDARATYRQARAEWQRQKTLAEQAKSVRDRTQRLFNLRAASREQVEAAEAQYRSLELSVANAQAEMEKSQFHLTDFLEVPLETAAEGKEDHLAEALAIRAPSAGTVMERSVTVGAVVSTGDPLFTVANLATLWLIANVNETDMSRVHPNQSVEVTVRAYPDRRFAGRVLKLGERLDSQTRTLQVRILVPNPQGALKPDMFAAVEFPQAAARAAVQVPESAVQQWNGKTVVFVRSGSGFAPHEVTSGAKTGDQVEIVAGLAPDTPVVVDGAFLLKSQLLKVAGE